jgi:c-di-GMP-binding flagellar brake protein YcgR
MARKKKIPGGKELTARQLDDVVMSFAQDAEKEEGILDRRQAPRFQVFGQVVCFPLGSSKEIRGELLDFSKGGLYFYSPRKLKEGDLVQVHFAVDGASCSIDSIAQAIRVTRVRKGYEIAMKFLSEE